MKNIWLLTKTNIKRNLAIVFIAIIGAAGLCFMISAMGRLTLEFTIDKPKIGIIDNDNSILSKDLKSYLTDKLHYEIMENFTYDEYSTELIEKHISVIIEVPKDFYNQSSLGNMPELIITTLDDYENAAFVQSYLNSYMSSIHILSDNAGGNKAIFDQLFHNYQLENTEITQTSATTVDKKAIADQGGFLQSIGFFMMFIFAISLVLTYMIQDDRLSGVFQRIQVTPVKPIQYIIGSALFGIFVCFVMVSIYCGYIKIMDINTGMPFALVVTIMSLFSLFTVGFSLAIALFFQTKNAVTSIVIGFSTIGCILGGAYFPLEMSPPSLQNLARILPQFWFMDTCRSLQANANANVLPNLIVLSLFTVLTYLIGAVLFSQHYKNN